MGALEADHPRAEDFNLLERRRDLSLAASAAWHAARLVPRDPDLWVFGNLNGRGFQGNAKWLFLEAHEHAEARCVWITLEPDVRDAVREQGLPCHLATSRKGAWAQARASTCFMTHGPWDFLAPLIGSATWIHLGHGIPIKEGEQPREGVIPWWDRLPWWRRGVDLYVAPSPALEERFAGLLTPQPRAVEGLGAPRLDALFEPDPTEPELEARADALAGDEELVLYLPTWRPWLAGEPLSRVLDPAGFDPDAVDQRLAAMGARLAMKPHPRMTAGEAARLDALDRVHLLDPAAFPELGPLLRRCAALVTDYSSVYFDVLPRGVPLVFLAHDADRFHAEDRIPDDYEDTVPGPVVDDWPAALDRLQEALDGPDPYADEREALREEVWGDVGPGQSRRVLEGVRAFLDR